MKQSLLNADFKSALNIMNKKRFSNSELEKGRSRDLSKLAISVMAFITSAFIFTFIRYNMQNFYYYKNTNTPLALITIYFLFFYH